MKFIARLIKRFAMFGRFIRGSFFFLIISANTLFSAQILKDEKTVKYTIDRLIEEQMQKQQIPGLALAVIVDNQPFYVQGYGKADLFNRIRVTNDTLFGIGSCSKAITAFAVMLLVEEGKIRLNASIREYIPEVPVEWQNVTIARLLSHTSGIPQRSGPHLPWDKVWQELARMPMKFNPGTRTEYSNFGFIVLCRLVEIVANEDYESFVSQRILRPLGMTSTTIPPVPRPSNLAIGYTIKENKLAPIARLLPWKQMWGSGGFVSNISDLAKWDMAMTSGAILKPETYQLMWTPVMLNNGMPSGWCLGWQVSQANKPFAVSKDGGITGYRSLIVRRLEQGVSIIYLTNATTVKFNFTQPIFKLIKESRQNYIPPPPKPKPPWKND